MELEGCIVIIAIIAVIWIIVTIINALIHWAFTAYIIGFLVFLGIIPGGFMALSTPFTYLKVLYSKSKTSIPNTNPSP
jgi:hypothetical protein